MAGTILKTNEENSDNRFWNEVSMLLGSHKSNSRYYSKAGERELYERDLALLLKRARKKDSAVYRALVRRYIREMKPMREFNMKKIRKYAAKNTAPGMLIKCRTRDGRLRYYMNAGYDRLGRPVVKRLSAKQMKMFLSKKLRSEIEREYGRRSREQMRVKRTAVTKTRKTEITETRELSWFEKSLKERIRQTGGDPVREGINLVRSLSIRQKNEVRTLVKKAGLDPSNDNDVVKYFNRCAKRISAVNIEEIRIKEEKEFIKKKMLSMPGKGM